MCETLHRLQPAISAVSADMDPELPALPLPQTPAGELRTSPLSFDTQPETLSLVQRVE